MTADYLLGGDKLFSQQARHDGFGHHATADEGEPRALKRVALFIWFLYFSVWHIPLNGVALRSLASGFGRLKNLRRA
jgi:hypothetical protein